MNKDISEARDLKLILADELTARCRKNPNYSLRSFAKSIKIHHGQLSRILSGQRPLTAKMSQRIQLELGLRGLQFQEKKSPQTFNVINPDMFSLIADWYHDALLELPRIGHFVPNQKWLARVLNLSQSQIVQAVERLQRLGLLKIEKNGRWKVTPENSTNIPNSNYTDVASRLYQKQVLEKAIVAVDEIAIQKRDNTSVTMAIDSKDIPKIKEMIKVFRREVISYSQRKSSKPDQVYQINISLFPLTNIDEGTNNENI